MSGYRRVSESRKEPGMLAGLMQCGASPTRLAAMMDHVVPILNRHRARQGVNMIILHCNQRGVQAELDWSAWRHCMERIPGESV
ncbi:MAG: hypothetical protein FD134_2621 [Gallionellaceae bacterium]|nr:MAG: hypothetical protein FD134_2621 [Gallionellaceae bacterium]